jgi:hypothetical protein
MSSRTPGPATRAVLLLLARLGLRAIEVSRPQLDDRDWHAGEISVDVKAHRHDQLPLPYEGASMIDISQVLRHNRLQSTAIYAKVDLGRLRLAASPWPGAIR